MQKKLRPTYAEVDLSSIKHNLALVKEKIRPKTKVLVVVKAEAYGHGLLKVSEKLVGCGVDYLGAASVDEAINIRTKFKDTPILVFSPILPNEIDAILKYNLTQTIANDELAQGLQDRARQKKKRAKVHIKVDTGMGRIGVWHTQAADFIKRINQQSNLELEGIYTHFSSADEENSKFTHDQLGFFEAVVKKIESFGIKDIYTHAANSMGIIGFERAHLNLVRPGLMIYGLHPRVDLMKGLNLKPALSLKTKIVFIKEAEAGRSISYGRTYKTASNTKIATLPIGYGDGYPRTLSNKGYCLIRGKKAPVVGIVCMDHTMVDVGHIPGVKLGDEAVLIGTQENLTITAEEVAALANTIPYEIVTRIAPRVERVYKC